LLTEEPAVAPAAATAADLRRLIGCVLIHHDQRGTNVVLRHP
jgi:hypothetical protein